MASPEGGATCLTTAPTADRAKRGLVEAAGVEFEIRVIDNFLMARDFWG